MMAAKVVLVKIEGRSMKRYRGTRMTHHFTSDKNITQSDVDAVRLHPDDIVKQEPERA
jgi:hypothetical protein